MPSRSISGAVAREASSTSTRFLITNLISLHLHYLPFASRFHLPHFTNLPFFLASLFRSLFSLDLVTMSDFGMAETDNGQTPKIARSGNLDAKTFVLG